MNCQVSKIAWMLLIFSFIGNYKTSLVAANDSQVQNQNEQHRSSLKPRTSLRDLFSLGKADEEGPPARACIIEHAEVTKIPGRCIKLLGGRNACLGGDVMDPIADSCNEEY